MAPAKSHTTASASSTAAPRPSTIELGEMVPPDEARPDPRGLPPRMVHGLVAGWLAVSCLLGLTASARGEPGLSRPLWTTTVVITGFSLGSESIYVTEAGGTAVTGRRLETGELRWRLSTDDPVVSTTDTGHGVAAVTTLNPETSAGEHRESTVVLVAEATGQVRATLRGDVFAPTVAGHLTLVVSQRPELASHCAGGLGLCIEMSAINTQDGTEAWRIPIPAEGFFLADWSSTDAIDRFATLGPARLLVVWDAESAAVTDQIALPAPPAGAEETAALVGNTLVTAWRDRGRRRGEVVGYRLNPVRRAWSLPVPMDVPLTEYNSWFLVSGCGDIVCLHVNGGQMFIDPLSGAVRLRLAAEVITQLGGGGLLALPPTQQRLPAGSQAVLLQLDPTNGRTVRTFPDSVIVDWADSGGRALLMRQGSQGTGFTIVDEDGRPHPLGSVAGTGLNCLARHRLLACTEPAGLLRVWRLPA